MSATQQNADSNNNQGAYVGEIEASLADLFSNFGASTSTATSTGTGLGTFDIGAKTVNSGRTTSIANEKIGTVKMLVLVGVCIASFIAYKKWGK